MSPKSFTKNKKGYQKTLRDILKKPKKVEEKKREIHLITDTVLEPDILTEDEIHVSIGIELKDKLPFYRLKIISNQEFYLPVSENPIDWGHRMRKESTIYCSSNKIMLDYLKTLQESNKAVLAWSEGLAIDLLKKRFEKKYGEEFSKEEL